MQSWLFQKKEKVSDVTLQRRDSLTYLQSASRYSAPKCLENCAREGVVTCLQSAVQFTHKTLRVNENFLTSG